MAAALEGASERQLMVVAENLNGHITPLRRSAIARRQLARCSDSESATLRLSCAPPRGASCPERCTHGPWYLGPGRARASPAGHAAGAVQAASGVLPLARNSGHRDSDGPAGA
jgi:hypothetical protein